MRKLFVVGACLSIVLSACSPSLEPDERASYAEEQEEETIATVPSEYRGWDYIAEKLITDGVPPALVKKVYSDPRMPLPVNITFRLSPKETHAQYTGFRKPELLAKSLQFIAENRPSFSRAQSIFKVEPEIIAAILCVESQFGRYTGSALLIERLSRVSSVKAPEILKPNAERLLEEDSAATPQAIKARAQYLEDTFYPEVLSLFKIGAREKLDLFALRGSIAGAFGMPQFLPTSYIKYAVDGNNNGKTSLFEKEDAILSVAKYLRANGWNTYGSHDEKAKVLWTYNKSTPYIETLLWIAERLDSLKNKLNQRRQVRKSR